MQGIEGNKQVADLSSVIWCNPANLEVYEFDLHGYLAVVVMLSTK